MYCIITLFKSLISAVNSSTFFQLLGISLFSILVYLGPQRQSHCERTRPGTYRPLNSIERKAKRAIKIESLGRSNSIFFQKHQTHFFPQGNDQELFSCINKCFYLGNDWFFPLH